jgi:hypothetical protein
MMVAMMVVIAEKCRSDRDVPVWMSQGSSVQTRRGSMVL